jgi:predicted metalloprotease with PDZ domain
VDDQVVSLNGERLRAAELDQRVRRLAPGDPVTLKIVRHEMEREVVFPAAGRPAGRWSLRRVADPTAAQRQVYESWLGQPWPAVQDIPAASEGAEPPTEDPHATSRP